MGGIARRGIYNMKTAVDKVKKGKGRTVNRRFAVMCAHCLFDADFCNVASGWTKGVVEKNVQDSMWRIWIDAAQQRFGSSVALNDWLGRRCPSRPARFAVSTAVFTLVLPRFAPPMRSRSGPILPARAVTVPAVHRRAMPAASTTAGSR